ncbi:MAG: M6 family metalloprotease domain-containing protein, partial [Nitrospinota bacterium]
MYRQFWITFFLLINVVIALNHPALSQTPTSPKALVLLVDFPDRAGAVSPEYFRDLLFGTSPSVAPQGSLRDYYLEVSYGVLQLEGEVNAPGVSWLRLPQEMTYYAGGRSGVGSYPNNAQKMVEDAVVAARAAGIDFGPYDTDNDGYVDALFVVHAGRGAEYTGSGNDIWSHRWVTRSPVATGSTNAAGQPVYVYGYTTEPETWFGGTDMTIGVFAHEYGHTLGLPDLYDTDYSSKGVGDWSLMGSGSWNGGMGEVPAHLDAWSKCVLGWVTPVQVTGTLVDEPISQVESEPDVYQFGDGDCRRPGHGEYFLVEN